MSKRNSTPVALQQKLLSTDGVLLYFFYSLYSCFASAFAFFFG